MKGTAVLVCVLAACVALHAADTIEIDGAEAFAKLRDEMKAATGAAYTKNINLTAALLNLTDTPLAQPLGTKADGTCTPFSGTFFGNSNTVLGLQFESKDVAEAALFCELKDATVQDLKFEEGAMTATKSAAMLALKASGAVTLVNVHTDGAVNALNAAGLLVDAATTKLNVTACSNKGTVTVQGEGAGLVARAGTVSKQATGTVVLARCENSGNIIASADNVVHAGLFATVCAEQATVEDCVNKGSLTPRETTVSVVAGGIVAVVSGDGSVSVARCSSTADIISKTNATHTGGIIAQTKDFSGTLVVEDCYSTATISASKVESTDVAVGGIIGVFSSEGVTKSVIRRCNNSGAISADVKIFGSGSVAGICGSVAYLAGSKGLTISSCYNTGAIETNANTAGIVCGTEKYAATVLNSANSGALKSPFAFGIASYAEAADNVVSTGALTVGTLSNELWKSCQGTCTNAYQSIKEDADTYITKKDDGFYYTSKDNRRVDQALNLQVRAMDYDLYWTEELALDFEGNEPSALPSSLPSASASDSNASPASSSIASSDSSSSQSTSSAATAMCHALQFAAACALGVVGLLL